MTNFIIGAIFGIAALLLFIYIMGTIEDRRLNKDFEIVMKPKSEMNIERNITICMQDDEYTAMHLDNDENIEAFMTFHPNDIKSADFYYSLFNNKQLIKIYYKQQNYKAVITQMLFIDKDTLRIYYRVIK